MDIFKWINIDGRYITKVSRLIAVRHVNLNVRKFNEFFLKQSLNGTKQVDQILNRRTQREYNNIIVSSNRPLSVKLGDRVSLNAAYTVFPHGVLYFFFFYG